MSKFVQALAVAALCVIAPSSAQAGPSVAVSLGYGYEVSPEHQTQATNLMVAPGFDFAGLLRAELGIVGAWEAARARQVAGLGLEFRPMLMIAPPLFPLYGRVILAAVDPFASTRTVAWGAALGLRLSLIGVGIFAEAGFLPRSIDSVISWVIEGRAGVSYSF